MASTDLLHKDEKKVIKSARNLIEKAKDAIKGGKYDFKKVLLQLSGAHEGLSDFSKLIAGKEEYKAVFTVTSKAVADVWKCYSAVSGVGQLTHNGHLDAFVPKLEKTIESLNVFLDNAVVRVIKKVRNGVKRKVMK